MFKSVLYGWANLRRACQAPKYWSSTNFHIKDLWKVDLSKADVVAVYGLHPIMKQLGKKMKAELKPGSIVVSNVFTIPGWRPIRGSTDRVHFYSIPESIINVQKKSYSKWDPFCHCCKATTVHAKIRKWDETPAICACIDTTADKISIPHRCSLGSTRIARRKFRQGTIIIGWFCIKTLSSPTFLKKI